MICVASSPLYSIKRICDNRISAQNGRTSIDISVILRGAKKSISN